MTQKTYSVVKNNEKKDKKRSCTYRSYHRRLQAKVAAQQLHAFTGTLSWSVCSAECCSRPARATSDKKTNKHTKPSANASIFTRFFCLALTHAPATASALFADHELVPLGVESVEDLTENTQQQQREGFLRWRDALEEMQKKGEKKGRKQNDDGNKMETFMRGGWRKREHG